MGKTFIYTKQCGPSQYSEYRDEEFCDEENFEYEVDWGKVKDACADLTYENFFLRGLMEIPEIKENKELQKQIRKVIESGVSKFVSELDIEDPVEEYFDESLKDYFEEDAMESWKNR